MIPAFNERHWCASLQKVGETSAELGAKRKFMIGDSFRIKRCKFGRWNKSIKVSLSVDEKAKMHIVEMDSEMNDYCQMDLRWDFSQSINAITKKEAVIFESKQLFLVVPLILLKITYQDVIGLLNKTSRLCNVHLIPVRVEKFCFVRRDVGRV